MSIILHTKCTPIHYLSLFHSLCVLCLDSNAFCVYVLFLFRLQCAPILFIRTLCSIHMISRINTYKLWDTLNICFLLISPEYPSIVFLVGLSRSLEWLYWLQRDNYFYNIINIYTIFFHYSLACVFLQLWIFVGYLCILWYTLDWLEYNFDRWFSSRIFNSPSSIFLFT